MTWGFAIASVHLYDDNRLSQRMSQQTFQSVQPGQWLLYWKEPIDSQLNGLKVRLMKQTMERKLSCAVFALLRLATMDWCWWQSRPKQQFILDLRSYIAAYSTHSSVLESSIPAGYVKAAYICKQKHNKCTTDVMIQHWNLSKFCCCHLLSMYRQARWERL